MDKQKDKTDQLFEKLKQPNIAVTAHQRQFRLVLLNTKKSAISGAVLLILPLLFLSGVVLKHYLQIDFGMFTSVYEWIGNLDQKYGDKSLLNWIIRILLIFGPLAAIGVNLLAIMHVRFEKDSNELILSFKLKWLNWLIITTCTMVFGIFFLYLITENAH
ncbi:MAG: hypothetical protein RIG77_11250 [Cyclobacteriaceae bacterium]